MYDCSCVRSECGGLLLLPVSWYYGFSSAKWDSCRARSAICIAQTLSENFKEVGQPQPTPNKALCLDPDLLSKLLVCGWMMVARAT